MAPVRDEGPLCEGKGDVRAEGERRRVVRGTAGVRRPVCEVKRMN